MNDLEDEVVTPVKRKTVSNIRNKDIIDSVLGSNTLKKSEKVVREIGGADVPTNVNKRIIGRRKENGIGVSTVPKEQSMDNIENETQEQPSKHEIPNQGQQRRETLRQEMTQQTEEIEGYRERSQPQPQQELPPQETLYLKDLKALSMEKLVEMAQKYNVPNIVDLNKYNIISAILKNFLHVNPSNIIITEGYLELAPDGFGFLKNPNNNYTSSTDDVYVSVQLVKRFSLRSGDFVVTEIKAPPKNEKYFFLSKPISVNNKPLEHLKTRVRFEDLTPLYPNQKLSLENEIAYLKTNDDSSRIIDLITPIGKGQRAMIVAPPKTGKTMLLQSIAHAITSAHPDAYLIVLLIDERPEEVTDMSRNVKGEVVSSTFDEPSTRHVQLAEIIIEKAKRMVEYGQDVIILLDSITRLARAYNNVVPSTGKILTGGVDSNALQRPKRFFGAARNIEQGGSLTIIATALVETGSKMDEIIFEEFKGTGNSEIVLDRKISDKRIFPAIDITKSSTRKDDLLVPKLALNKIWMIRKIVSNMSPLEAIEFLKDKLKHTKNNQEFLDNMNG
jgi:transcription termination factor Rho